MVVFMISQKSDAWMCILVHQVLKVIPHLVIQLWRDRNTQTMIAYQLN